MINEGFFIFATNSQFVFFSNNEIIREIVADNYK